MQTSSQNGRGSRWLGAGLAFPASLVVLIIIMVPILQLARYSFNHFDPAELMQTAFTFENYAKFFGDPYYRDIFLTTLWIAALCTVLALVLGFPVAYFLARTQSRYKSLFVILLVFPLMVGNVVRAAGWMVALGNAGVVNAVLQGLGLIDKVIREPIGGAHRNPTQMGRRLKAVLLGELDALEKLSIDELLDKRYKRLRGYGTYEAA